VWRTEDGEHWTSIPLDLGVLQPKSNLGLRLFIVAGPRGVVVVGSDDFVPAKYYGVYVWHSADGHRFSAMTRIPGPDREIPPSVAVNATPDGFLLGMTGKHKKTLLSSGDGAKWQNVSTTTLPTRVGINHVSGNDTAVVAFDYDPQNKADSKTPLAWYLDDGAWHPATLDPGRLPDHGVVPPDELRVNEVRNWGTGFIAIGNTAGGDGHETSGLVWYSPDGHAWKRMPVSPNGFESAAELMDLAVNKDRAVLVGFPISNSDKPMLWQAKAPPSAR
jgi:hypothetical protein